MRTITEAGERTVDIFADHVILPGDLTIPSLMTSLVIFAHGRVPGTTHLFEERGTFEEVARVASNWFKAYLVPSV
jgi:hypothetical protein